MTERITAELLAPVRRDIGRDGDTSLAGKDAFASLPVLGAVRQFIDNERRRTRRMIQSLLLLFAVVLIGFISAFIYIAAVQMRQVRTSLENGQKTIAAAASQIDVMKKDITDEAQKLNARLADGGKQAELAMTAVKALDASITNAVMELQMLKRNLDGVDDLKSQNIKTLSDLDLKWNLLSSRMETLSKQNSLLRARLEGRPDGQPPPYAPVMPPVVKEKGISLDIATSNAERRINWRLPMP
ncbi:MAG: hypothetical protein WCN95_12090 [bacterium]